MGMVCNRLLVKLFVIISTVIFLASCAGGGAVQISKQELNTIKSISIDPEIKKPDEPFVQGAGNFAAFLIGGGIGVAAEQKAAGKIFKEYLDRNNIDISKIVYDEFKNAIIEDNIFKITENSKAKLKLVINVYGFGKSSVFASGDRRPMLNVTASLIKGDTETIWQKKDYITNLNGSTDEYTYDQLAANPQLIEKSLKQVSAMVAHLILADLKRI